MPRKSKKVGLVLGSGGARGWAHFGVLRALEEAGIRFDYIAGTSAGAMVGAFLAAGKMGELHTAITKLKWKDVLYYFSDVTRAGAGLVEGAKIIALFHEILGDLRIEDLDIPFAAVATDVQTGREVIIRKGSVVDAIRASISIPGIFAPVEHDGVYLVDGGLVNPVPVTVARSMGADFVVAVNVLGTLRSHAPLRTARDEAEAGRRASLPEIWRLEKGLPFLDRIKTVAERIDLGATLANRPWLRKNRGIHLFDVLSNSVRIMEIQIAEACLQRDAPDVIIRPDVGGIGTMEFDNMKQAETAGYLSARAKIYLIRELAKG